jgi:tetrahydromethanopterin S-methyltransferase subunit E
VSNVDIYGHIGGFLTGLFFGMIIMVQFRGSVARQRGSYEKKVVIIGIIMLLILLILDFSLFYTVSKSAKYYDGKTVCPYSW